MAGALGVPSKILTWDEAAGGSGLQARARHARYRLLLDACHEEGITELYLGHTLEDQAETFLLRLDAGSDLPGLACMAGRSWQEGVALIRPLLGVRRLDLRRWLQARKLYWIDDPSNQDRRFSRVRARDLLRGLAAEGVGASQLAATARDLGRLRARLEEAVAQRLKDCCDARPEGYMVLDAGKLLAPPLEIAGWALARCLLAVGGGEYAPRRERLQRLLRQLLKPGFKGATLGGCRIVMRGGALSILREQQNLPNPMRITRSGDFYWDGRFRVRLDPQQAGLTLCALGDAGWREIKDQQQGEVLKLKERKGVPAAVLATLPAISDENGVAEVPLLAFRRVDVTQPSFLSCRFEALNPLKDESFTVALAERHII